MLELFSVSCCGHVQLDVRYLFFLDTMSENVKEINCSL